MAPTAALNNEVRICQLKAVAPQRHGYTAHPFVARRLLHRCLHATRAAAWATLRWHVATTAETAHCVPASGPHIELPARALASAKAISHLTHDFLVLASAAGRRAARRTHLAVGCTRPTTDWRRTRQNSQPTIDRFSRFHAMPFKNAAR